MPDTPEHQTTAEDRRCGTCRWWGERGSTAVLRPCTFPLPKWLERDWATAAENDIPCATWALRLPGDDRP